MLQLRPRLLLQERLAQAGRVARVVVLLVARDGYAAIAHGGHRALLRLGLLRCDGERPVLVVLGLVLVARAGPQPAISPSAPTQQVDVGGRRAEADARAHGAGERGRRPARSSADRRPTSASVDPSRRAISGCAQKQPWRTPIACSALRIAASSGCAVAVEVEGGDADAVAPGAVHRRQQLESRHLRESVPQARRQEPLVLGDGVHAEREQAAARRRERDDADHVRRAGLVALGRAGPDDVVERDELDRAAAVQQRRAVGEPRRRRPARRRRTARTACGRRARGSRCPRAAMSIGRCGASWAASTNSRRRGGARSRPARATGHTSPVTFEAPVTATRSIRGSRAQRALGRVEQLVGRVGERQQPHVVAPPRQHVRVVLDRAARAPACRRAARPRAR